MKPFVVGETYPSRGGGLLYRLVYDARQHRQVEDDLTPLLVVAMWPEKAGGEDCQWLMADGTTGEAGSDGSLDMVHEPELTPEVGKLYRTRDGRKAFVAYSTEGATVVNGNAGPAVRSFRGAIVNQRGGLFAWGDDGRASLTEKLPEELVAEWSES